MNKFVLKSTFRPTGDQPDAIAKLVSGLKKSYRDQTLLGVTGSGKTFTMANVIAQAQKPTLVISHNKTLAAQLYGEFRQFFPDNAVHYFVSYYDYYQPEAYIPQTDTYIEKEATINEEIDRLRHAATQSLMSRNDVLIVASVSCIYGLGERADYEAMSLNFTVGQIIKRNEILRQLIKIQYERNDSELKRGQFRVNGEIIDLHLATGEAIVRIIMAGDAIEKIFLFNIKPGKEAPANFLPLLARERAVVSSQLNKITILPAKHFMTTAEKISRAMSAIREELKQRLADLNKQNKPVEAYRLEKKTNFDLEMIEQVGYCNGIENYSRHLSGRSSGSPPETLMDFFPDDYLIFADESHVTLPQIRGMFAGDRSRKQTLIDFGFRLPSAIDNRPLNFEEFSSKIKQIIYVSATPAEFEVKNSAQIVEQLIRPTGLLDPEIEIRSSGGVSDEAKNFKQADTAKISLQKNNSSNIIVTPTANGQIADLIGEIEKRADKFQRVLVTTLTKRMAEELTGYLAERGVKVQYLHSEVDTLERVEILRDLRQGKYDVLVGINLLREGLDLPEVSLVAILDADMSGFLRNETSLIQTIGRAARHLEGKVIMYADRITPAMRYAVMETRRRRGIQEKYNKKNGITPQSVQAKFHQSII